MAAIKPRDRIVVFRLTQDEYKRLKKACSSTGARNLSDYTRRELLESSGRGRIEGRLSAFEKKLAELHSAIRHINRLLESK